METNQHLTFNLGALNMIKKEGSEYILYSKDGKKKLGRYKTKQAAENREKQVNYSKHKGEK